MAYPISQEQFKNLRNSLSWPFSHIRTFRAKAYHEIEKQDPNYDCLKDENGKMYTIGAGDFAVFLPVAEIVGYENIKYNDGLDEEKNKLYLMIINDVKKLSKYYDIINVYS